MSSSIAKALVLSFLAHYVLLFVILQFQTEPAIIKTIPILIVQSQDRHEGDHVEESVPTETEGDEGTNAALDFETQAADLLFGPVTEALLPRVMTQQKPDSRQAPRTTSNHEPVSGVFEVQADLAETPSEEGRQSSATSVVVAAPTQKKRSKHPLAVSREPEKITVSNQDRTMLEDKFRHWAEEFGQISENGANLDWVHEGQTYSASFRQLPAEDEVSMGQVVVEISKEEDGTKFTTKMRMKNLSFSNYAQFVNWWNPNVQIHDDVSVGRFHSNSQVHLAYSRKVKPVFLGKVTTSHRKINTSNSSGRFRRHEIFPGGLETGVRKIDMPKSLSLFADESSAENVHFRVFEEDTRITFYADGSYGWSPVKPETPEQLATVSGEAAFLVGGEKAKLHVKGVVNGKVLVYSPDGIVIEDDLLYAEHPDTVPDSDDFLGLVSERSIEIAGPNLTGPGDLMINAAIYARRSFTVKRYSARNDGTMSIYGSLAAGSMSATEPRYGTNIRFDQRLEHTRPPRFPVTDRYEVSAWDGNWEVQK